MESSMCSPCLKALRLYMLESPRRQLRSSTQSAGYRTGHSRHCCMQLLAHQDLEPHTR